MPRAPGSRLTRSLFGLALTLAALFGLTGRMASSVAATPPAGPPVTFTSVSCAASSECVAVGKTSTRSAAVATSTDGGDTWTVRAVSPLVLPLEGVSCPSRDDCVAVGWGGAVLTTSDGGQSWTAHSARALADALEGVDCSTIRRCIAVGEGASTGLPALIIATTDGGATWHSQKIPHGVTGVGGVTCLSALRCWVVGGAGRYGTVLQTTDGGAAWTRETLPHHGIDYLYTITCRSAVHCSAGGVRTPLGGGVLVETSNGGKTWSRERIPAMESVDTLTCASRSFCVAAGFAPRTAAAGGGEVIQSQTGGTSWSVEPIPSTVLTVFGAACPSRSTCLAVGSTNDSGVVLITHDSGATWKAVFGDAGTD